MKIPFLQNKKMTLWRYSTKTVFNEEQQKLFVLSLTKACLEYGGGAGKSFEEVLKEDVFPNEVSEEFEEVVCTTLLALKEQGYISGMVELVYETETDSKTFEVTELDTLDTPMCTFADINITPKGESYLTGDGFKKAGKDFFEKAKPVIKCIALTALQVTVETVITAGLKATGISV